MKVHEFIGLILQTATIAVCFILLSGCSVKPDERVVKDTIARYFREKNYKVVDIDIAALSSIPMKSRVYMGPEGYEVDVRSITLEATKDSGPPLNYRKGRRLSFDHALIRIIAGGNGSWVVSSVSGITVI